MPLLKLDFRNLEISWNTKIDFEISKSLTRSSFMADPSAAQLLRLVVSCFQLFERHVQENFLKFESGPKFALAM